MFRSALAFIVTSALGACASGCVTAPVASAQTLDQKAYAAYGTFVITEEQASQFLRQPNVPLNVKVSVAAADARAKASADALHDAVLDYQHAATQLKAGVSTQDQLDIANQNLASWLTHATADIQALVSSLKGAQP